VDGLIGIRARPKDQERRAFGPAVSLARSRDAAYRCAMGDSADSTVGRRRGSDEPTVVLGRTATTPYGKNEWWWPSGAAV